MTTGGKVKRRDLFKGIIATAAAIVGGPVLVFASRQEKLIVPLRLSWIIEIYETLSFGNEHPRNLYLSSVRWQELRAVVVKQDRVWKRDGAPLSSFMFYGMDVCLAKWQDDNHAFFFNIHRSPDGRFNRNARIGERIYYDAKGHEHREMITV